MDVEPPRIVLEHSELCADADRAAALLRRTLSPSAAPAPGWVVTMDVKASPSAAEGEISDGEGNIVGRRWLSRRTSECGGAARAVGVWASLVLDAERQRAENRAAPTSEASPGPRARAQVSATPAQADAPWPAPEPIEKPPPEAEWYLHHDDARSLELGAGAFLLTGTVGGALMGPTAFAVVESGRGVFLRPSLSGGATITTLPTSGPRSTWGAARFDVCLRIPGFYPNHRGLQLDACAGADAGLSWLDNPSHQTVPDFDGGPSLDLRGELGQKLAVLLRGVFGVNVVRADFEDDAGHSLRPPLWSGRLELALTWSLQ